MSVPAEFESAADPVVAWADAMLPGLRAAARARREAAEAAAAAKAEKRDAERVALRESAMAVLRRQLKHVGGAGVWHAWGALPGVRAWPSGHPRHGSAWGGGFMTLSPITRVQGM